MRRATTASFVAPLLTLGASLLLIACSRGSPALRVNIADQARDVPVDKLVEVTANRAVLERALLERLDASAAPVQLVRTDNGARLNRALEPDAQYRLTAVGRATGSGDESAAELTVQRVFSTVSAPALIGPALPLVLLRDRPLELRFSQPLAKATAEILKAPARAWIAREDPKVLRLEVKDAAPGQQLAVRLVDLVGINGAPAPEYEVVIETPQPVALASVSDHAVASQIKLPPDVAITLGWSRSVVSVEYRVGDKTAAWHGEATTTVELPVRARAAESQMLTILDAVAADGGWLPAALTFELSPLPPLGLVNLWPVDGATNVSVTGDPTFRFNEPIANSAAAEAAISFSPSVPGRFEWLTSDRVRFLPEDSFAPETQFTVHINGGSDGMRGVSGSALAESVTTTFETGKRKAIEVSLGKQILTLYEDDTPVWTAPVATGVRGAETPLGDYQVQYKMPQARFKGTNPDGSRYDIPDVHWVMPFYGDYTIHGAYWRSVFGRPGSAGCISLTDPNAKYVFDWADERTPVYIRA